MVKVNSDIEKLERRIDETRTGMILCCEFEACLYLLEKRLDKLKRKKEYIEFHIEIMEVDKELESEVSSDRE